MEKVTADLPLILAIEVASLLPSLTLAMSASFIVRPPGKEISVCDNS